MTMKNAPLLLLVSMAVSSVVYGQQSVPAGSTVFVDTNNGFDIFILAALQAKHVPLVLVSSRDKADYILDSALFHSSEFVATQKVAGTYRVSESAFKLTSKSGEVVFAYAATKGMFSKGKQSVAEACAKHLKRVVSDQQAPVVRNGTASLAGVLDITFTSAPPNALVIIGGAALGRTPFTAKLPTGAYKVTFSLAGYTSSIETIGVGAGYPLAVDAKLLAIQ